MQGFFSLCSSDPGSSTGLTAFYRLRALSVVFVGTMGVGGCGQGMDDTIGRGASGPGHDINETDGTHGGTGDEAGTGGATGEDPTPVVGEDTCVQDPDSAVPCRFEGLPDPEGWTVDPVTGLRYRRVTAHEQAANDWPASAYLVEADGLLDSIELGAKTVPALLIPIADDDLIPVTLEQIATMKGPEHVTVTESGTEVERPTFVSYASSGEQFPEVLFRVVGTVGGLRGLAGRGTAGGYDIYLASYADAWVLDDLGPGPAPEGLVRVNLLTLKGQQQEAHQECIQVGGCDDMCIAWAPADCGLVVLDEGEPCVYEGTHPCVNNKPTVDLKRCDNGIDDDGDGKVDFDGLGGMYAVDANCQHQPGCYANGTGEAALHHHLYESGEQIVLTGTLAWCAEDGDWAARGFELVTSGIGVFGHTTGYGAYDGLAGDVRNVMRWVGTQCWLLPETQVVPCQKDGDCGPFGPQSAHPYPFAGADRSFEKHLDKAWAAVAHASENGLLRPATIAAVAMRRKPLDTPAWGMARYPWSATPGAMAVVDYGGFMWGPGFAHEIGHTLGLEHDDDDPVMSSPSYGAAFSPDSAELILEAVRDVQIPRPYSYGK